ncbi:DUF2523 domain-containing protein [Acinetobacter chinensis]|uniref:DUF2523 domain-containing protein n=1 Tax=Acinetobacter chinensis TaxID=2004650 RepID=A0A3B7M0T5_9GAMM|nr:DUF2523 family protein [Acinetobacter chinensis]AXY56193.1 DUF2523 domain-containing protein [Acinetobacter chinensis]
MPALIAVLQFFAFNLVGWVLAGLGLALISYTGVDFLTQKIIQSINEQFQSLPPDALQVIRMMGIPTALSLWLSGSLTGMAVGMAQLRLVKR